MRTRDAEGALRELLKRRSIDLEASTPSLGFDALLEFYRDERVVDVDLAEDGDMMIYQWGVDRWRERPVFDLNLTRQLICGEGEDDDDIWQLSLTYGYGVSDELVALDAGQSEWCSGPDELASLRLFIESSTPWTLLAERLPSEVTIHFETV